MSELSLAAANRRFSHADLSRYLCARTAANDGSVKRSKERVALSIHLVSFGLECSGDCVSPTSQGRGLACQPHSGEHLTASGLRAVYLPLSRDRAPETNKRARLRDVLGTYIMDGGGDEKLPLV